MAYLLTADDVGRMSDDQKDAVMEALVFAVVADGRTSRPETDRFDAEAGAIPWGLDQPALIARMKAARTRVIGYPDEAAAVAAIRRLGARLPDPGVREKVFHAMAAIVFADDEVNTREINLLGVFADAFAMPRDRLDAIRADLVASRAPR